MTRPSHLTRNATARRRAVLLCLVALAALLFVQTLHTHVGASDADQTHCSICAAVHGATVALCVALLLLTVFADLRLRHFDLLEVPAKSHLVGFALFSRPPPVF